MYRINFTREDLVRTRLITSYGPYAEGLFSLVAACNRRQDRALFGGWRELLPKEVCVKAASLGALVRTEPILDLFTLIGPTYTMEEAVDGLLDVDTDALRREVDAAAQWARIAGPGAISTLPKWILRLPDDPAIRKAFAATLHAWCAAAIGPHWSSLQAHLAANAAQARSAGEAGLGELLNGLHPDMRWQGSTLYIGQSGHAMKDVAASVFPDGDVGVEDGVTEVHLNGRGLVLVGSVFCRHIIPYVPGGEHDGPVVLFFPALRDAADAYRLWASGQSSTHHALVALLGATRAAALESLHRASSTTDLARRLRISTATASHHTTILRDAGLITTRQVGGSVRHTLTPLGTALLNGAKPEPSPRAIDRVPAGSNGFGATPYNG